MINRIYEHSIDDSILVSPGYVLDAGCGVDFFFSKYMAEKGFTVISVDPNPKIIDIPKHTNIHFEHKALVSDSNKNAQMLIFDDTDAATIINTSNDVISKINATTVECTTVEEIMQKYSIKQFEIIKLDIEGSEYNISDNLDYIKAKQISVEFHDFRNMNPYYPDNEKYYFLLKQKLTKTHKIAKHEIEIHGGMPEHLQKNYWDSLFTIL